MKSRWGRCCAAALAVLILCVPGLSQDEKKKEPRAASLEGTSGLFRTWDAETLRRYEYNFTIGWNRYNRDPGELKLDTLPVGFAFGLHDRLEVFGSFDVVRRIQAPGIQPYRITPGRNPSPSTTPLGLPLFNNEAPFVDVPGANGIGDVRLGLKFMLFSERMGHALNLGHAGYVKIPTMNSATALNRGLGNGEVSAGYGLLLSKAAGLFGKFYLNTVFNFVRDPRVRGVTLANLQNEFSYRGGVALPNFGKFQFIAEADGTTYFGDRTAGANPRSPIDLIFGGRFYPNGWLSVGGGYRATLHRLTESPATRTFPGRVSGFVAQLAMGKRTNDPPTVSCAIANATIKQDEKSTIRANATDPDGDILTYTWSSTGGKLTGSGDTATFDATGIAPGKYTITATVSDGKHQASCTSEVTVVKKNLGPTVRCEPESASVTVGESTTMRAVASDPNNDRLTYTWTINSQRVAADAASITFGSQGRQPGRYTISVTVSDGELTASCSSTVTVNERPNRQPRIECLTTNVDVASGGSVELRVRASDPDNDSIRITWSATGGRVTGSGESATFNASGLKAGSYTVTASVEDGRGGRASCSMTVNVSERLTVCCFASQRYRVDNVMKAALDDLAVRMQNEPRLRANIIGYTDGSRAESRVKELGKKRAQAVADYLTKKKGIDGSRLIVTDAGSSNPVGDSKTSEGRKKNRRVEIELTTR